MPQVIIKGYQALLDEANAQIETLTVEQAMPLDRKSVV